MISRFDKIWKERDNYIEGRALSEKLDSLIKGFGRRLAEARLSDLGLEVALFEDRMHQFRADAANFVLTKAKRGSFDPL